MTQADRQQEHAHLTEVLKRLKDAAIALYKKLAAEGDTLLASKQRANEDFRSWEAGDEQADIAEVILDARQLSVDDHIRVNDTRKYHRLQRMLSKTYFGRIDWDDGLGAEPVYIGAYGYWDDERYETVVCDWRAPIAALFYEFEKGPARFTPPGGKEQRGTITLKRQFDIVGGEIRAMFDTDVRVLDALLMEALSRDTDGAMHAIFATLQREQYQLIRATGAANMVIYGVAGSGKTSIALHRIAWLIYTRKGALTSDNVRVLSPNRAFSSYIAGVLPEMGETAVRTMSMDGIAQDAVGAQSRYALLEYALALANPDADERIRNIRVKSGEAFARRLEAYLEDMFEQLIEPVGVTAARIELPAELIGDIFLNVFRGMAYAERVNALPGELHEHILARYNAAHGETDAERLAMDDQSVSISSKRDITSVMKPHMLKELRDALMDMLRPTDADTLYRRFLSVQGLSFHRLEDGRVPAEDAFPLMMIREALNGRDEFESVAHLVIDEMQDYTPVQYLWMRDAFSCERTILGDLAQHVQPVKPELSEEFFRELFGGAVSVHRLTKSYRSTLEIGTFCASLIGLKDAEWVARHGEEPRVIPCAGKREQLEHAHQRIEKAMAAGRTVAVLLKTQAAAKSFHERLNMPEAQLLDENTIIKSPAIVAAAYVAKGLEFDCVIVPDASEKVYRNALDLQQLYVACTRALHELTLLYTGAVTRFVGRG